VFRDHCGDERTADSQRLCVRSVNESDTLIHQHIRTRAGLSIGIGYLPIRSAHLTPWKPDLDPILERARLMRNPLLQDVFPVQAAPRIRRLLLRT